MIKLTKSHRRTDGHTDSTLGMLSHPKIYLNLNINKSNFSNINEILECQYCKSQCVFYILLMSLK